MQIYMDDLGSGERVKRQMKKEGYMYAHQRTRLGLKAGGDFLLKKSQEVCPVDTGKLRKSGYSKVSNTKLQVEVGYTARYAWFVHEMPQRKIRKTGKTNKYLERPARQHAKEMARVIAKAAREGR